MPELLPWEKVGPEDDILQIQKNRDRRVRNLFTHKSFRTLASPLSRIYKANVSVENLSKKKGEFALDPSLPIRVKAQSSMRQRRFDLHDPWPR